MKTEKQIIDDLGNWLCTDIEKSIAKLNLPMTEHYTKTSQIFDIAERIKYYRDNVID